MSAPDRACPDYPNDCMHPWVHARTYAEVKATQVGDDDKDRLYLDLKGARERLCRAQTGMNPTDSAILQGAIDRIDLVGCDLPQWSRHDGGRAS
ncbi:hypothetical protein ABZ949_01800 [Micromonospora tulbaghiae]|uniref:hypothetical protein n=1 Tax=Micromonospora tulbaghiae TaxID=479978 RepID=UPI0033DCBEF6